MHRVHVDLTWIRLVVGRLSSGVGVHVEGHLDVHLLASPLSDRLCNAKESRVRTRCGFRNRILFCEGIIIFEARDLIIGYISMAVGFLDIFLHVFVGRAHRVRCTENWSCSGRHNVDA